MDKVLHFLAGYFIGNFLAVITGAWWFGFIASCFAAASKEYWDSKGNGEVEFADFYFTAFGGLLGASMVFIRN